MKPNRRGKALHGLNIVVVGAGPGGLVFAKNARQLGADIDVLEYAGDPRNGDAGYTDRSFNLTLNQVGRTILGDVRAWDGGTDVRGRAIHSKESEHIKYASFGDTDEALLVSIPRPVLRQNMVAITEEIGVKIHFNSHVVDINPDTGTVGVEVNGIRKELVADLIVIADGLHSLADSIIIDKLGGTLNMRTEPLNYVKTLLSKDVCKDFSLHHIHFWHEKSSNAVAIGLPNKDGTIAALLISKYEDVRPEDSPFPDIKSATQRMISDFPQLLELDPGLPEQVLGKERAYFHYKSISKYVLGRRCVVVGDAGSASPPWAGFGANTAMYGADALVRFITHGDNLEQSLKDYETYKLVLADLVLEYADEHGEFLNKKVTENPEQKPIGPVLGQLINKAAQTADVPRSVGLLTFS